MMQYEFIVNEKSIITTYFSTTIARILTNYLNLMLIAEISDTCITIPVLISLISNMIRQRPSHEMIPNHVDKFLSQ